MADPSSGPEAVAWVEILPSSLISKNLQCYHDRQFCSHFPKMTLNQSSSASDGFSQSPACVQTADNIHEHIKQIELIPCTVLILFTNFTVLMFIFANKNCRTPTYIFVASLGVADLFVGFVSIVTLATKANEHELDLCLVRIGVTIASLAASVLSLTCVALDRYVAITRALLYTSIMTKRKAIVGVIISWTFAFAIGFAPLIGWRKQGTYEQYCSFIYVLPSSYIITLFITSAFIPITVMFIIYVILFKNAQFHIKNIEAIEKIHAVSERNNSGLFGISTRTLRSIKTFAAVFGCLVVTWCPFLIATVIEISDPQSACILKDIVGTHLLVLGFSNSFLNPIIYALGTKDFRTKVKKMFQGWCYRAGSQVFPLESRT